MARKKMSLATLKSFYGVPTPPIPGDPNTRTPATKKGHVHVVRVPFAPTNGLVSPAEYRRRSKKRNRTMKERRINHK